MSRLSYKLFRPWTHPGVWCHHRLKQLAELLRVAQLELPGTAQVGINVLHGLLGALGCLEPIYRLVGQQVHACAAPLVGLGRGKGWIHWLIGNVHKPSPSWAVILGGDRRHFTYGWMRGRGGNCWIGGSVCIYEWGGEAEIGDMKLLDRRIFHVVKWGGEVEIGDMKLLDRTQCLCMWIRGEAEIGAHGLLQACLLHSFFNWFMM